MASSKASKRKQAKKDGVVATANTEAAVRNAMMGVDGVTRFERYQTRVVHRSDLKKAPYNPRHMSEIARKKLRAAIESGVGLIEPPIWNQRSGNLVGGHQRLSILDALEGTHDYYLTVSVVDMDEQTEKETNILLNNQEVQGEWDMELLGKMFFEDKVSAEGTGFSTKTIQDMFGMTTLVESQTPEALTEIADKMRQTWEQYESHSTENDEARAVNFYLVVVFKNNLERSAFCTVVGVEDDFYLNGSLLWSILGISPPSAESEASLTSKTEKTEPKPKLVKKKTAADREAGVG